jgi:hypothetical protein
MGGGALGYQLQLIINVGRHGAGDELLHQGAGTERIGGSIRQGGCACSKSSDVTFTR